MLVDINLLPKKEGNQTGSLLLIILIVLIAFVGGGLFYWQYDSGQDQLTALNQQIEMTTKLAEAEQQKVVAVENANSVNQLQTKVTWIETYPIKSVPLLESLIRLLPERGFLKVFNYVDTGTVKLNVQFDTSTDAAYYLKELTNATFVKEAKILSLETSPLEEENVDANAETASGPKVDNEKYNPRYLVTFELSMDLVELKKMTENKAPEEGEDTE